LVIVYAAKNTGSSISRLVLIISGRKVGVQEVEKAMIFFGHEFCCVTPNLLFKRI